MTTLIENNLESKVHDAINFLQHHEPLEGYYVAFSGGKDSIVTLDLVRKSGIKHDVHMNLTSVDPPELLKFVREYYPEIDFVKPKISMAALIIKKGFPPTRRIRYCCEFLKEHSGENRFVITGVRREESFRRANYDFIARDTNEKKNKTHIRPIVVWTESDVWEYIGENKLPYCSLYDEGQTRIGCVMCPMTGKAGMIRDKERWPHIYRMYEGACEKGIRRREQIGKPITQKTGKEMMDWWIYSQR